MDFTCIFFGFLFTFAGLWFAFGKGYLHLSLWKNMPQKEKDKLRIVPLCRNIGGIITLNGIIFLVKGFLPLFSNHWFVSAMIESSPDSCVKCYTMFLPFLLIKIDVFS